MATADYWLNLRFNNHQAVEATRQATLQAHFVGQLATVGDPKTQRFLKKMYWRVGKLLWRAAQEFTNRQPPYSIGQWGSTDRENVAEEMLQMNCWEAILYTAYQCGTLSKGKIRSLYTGPSHHSVKLTRLFGAHHPYGGAGAPNPGDILTFFNQGKGEIDHVAVFVGNDATGTPYLIHNLAWCAQTTGIQGGGCIHFETVQNTISNYLWSNYGAVTCFYTAPFWTSTSVTRAYAKAL